MKHNAPKERTCGLSLKKCVKCNRNGAHLSQYGINLCRQCFRENAKQIGFIQYS